MRPRLVDWPDVLRRLEVALEWKHDGAGDEGWAVVADLLREVELDVRADARQAA